MSRGRCGSRLQASSGSAGLISSATLTASGRWRSAARASPPYPRPGGDVAEFGGALDCDLGFSPLTNTMPVSRHRLHRESGRVDFVTVWISVPDLGVHALHQRYEHLGVDTDGAIVRYASVEERRETFTAELEIDPDGLVRRYPG